MNTYTGSVRCFAMSNIGRRGVLLCLLLGALVMGGCEGDGKPAPSAIEAAAIHQEGTEKGLADIDLAHNTFSLEPVGAPDPANGTWEVNRIDSSHASQGQLDAIQAYLDSLDFETVDLEEWAGGDLAKAMEGEYAALDVVTLHYFVRVAPYSPGLARVEATARLGGSQTTGVTWRAYYRADEQAAPALLALVGCSFIDWEAKIAEEK